MQERSSESSLGVAPDPPHLRNPASLGRWPLGDCPRQAHSRGRWSASVFASAGVAISGSRWNIYCHRNSQKCNIPAKGFFSTPLLLCDTIPTLDGRTSKSAVRMDTNDRFARLLTLACWLVSLAEALGQPAIISTMPAEMATGVPTTASVVFTFSKTMNWKFLLLGMANSIARCSFTTLWPRFFELLPSGYQASSIVEFSRHLDFGQLQQPLDLGAAGDFEAALPAIASKQSHFYQINQSHKGQPTNQE